MNSLAKQIMIGIMRHPRASALNAVFASDLPSTHIVPPSMIVGRLVDCPSSWIASAIVHSSHPADALPSSIVSDNNRILPLAFLYIQHIYTFPEGRHTYSYTLNMPENAQEIQV